MKANHPAEEFLLRWWIFDALFQYAQFGKQVETWRFARRYCPCQLEVLP